MYLMPARIELTDKPDASVAKSLSLLLLAFNNEKSGYAYDGRPLAITITDEETGEILGGLWGATGYGYLHIDLLYVPESMRGNGVGRSVMRQAEDEAIERGCRGAWLDTFTFQARGFYEKLGYSVISELEDTPPGHARLFMKKIFKVR
jgi:GNAT superfamily N-acetyltransferase